MRGGGGAFGASGWRGRTGGRRGEGTGLCTHERQRRAYCARAAGGRGSRASARRLPPARPTPSPLTHPPPSPLTHPPLSNPHPSNPPQVPTLPPGIAGYGTQIPRLRIGINGTCPAAVSTLPCLKVGRRNKCPNRKNGAFNHHDYEYTQALSECAAATMGLTSDCVNALAPPYIPPSKKKSARAAAAPRAPAAPAAPVVLDAPAAEEP